MLCACGTSVVESNFSTQESSWQQADNRIVGMVTDQWTDKRTAETLNEGKSCPQNEGGRNKTHPKRKKAKKKPHQQTCKSTKALSCSGSPSGEQRMLGSWANIKGVGTFRPEQQDPAEMARVRQSPASAQCPEYNGLARCISENDSPRPSN